MSEEATEIAFKRWSEKQSPEIDDQTLRKIFNAMDEEDKFQIINMSILEDKIQAACVTWFSLQYKKYAMLLHHSPNGGYRNKKEAAKFKRMGVRAGFPDLVLLIPTKLYNALFIELKTESKTSKLSDSQKNFKIELEKQGYKHVVCRSLESFQKEIEEYIKN